MIKLFRIIPENNRYVPLYIAPERVCAVFEAGDKIKGECTVVTQEMTFPRVIGTAEKVANRIEEALNPPLAVEKEPMPPLQTLPDSAFTALPIRRPGDPEGGQ